MLRLTKQITCPEMAHLETIQYTLDADGYIDNVEACSAFEPCAAVDCAQLCRHRLNQRRRTERAEAAEQDDVVTRV